MPVHFLCDWLLLTGALCVFAAKTTAFTTSRRPTKFKAAVYENTVILADSSIVLSRAEALAVMKKNLDIFSKQVVLAKEQGAEIIAFPEDGMYGASFTRETFYPYLEEIPDPREVNWSPCQDPTRYNNTEVQYTFSCMARQQAMYVVGNMGDKKPCDVTLDPECPPDGRYQYNTAVVFGPDGRLLARYHKSHLYFDEVHYNVPKPEVIYFDTSFGRFGLLICYDIFVYEPAVTMVTQYQIANIVFLTAWTNELPLLSSVGYHSSFARTWGVNFLDANVQNRIEGTYGSGIYGPDGMKALYYNTTVNPTPKLIVTELDVLDKPQPKLPVPMAVLERELEKTQQAPADFGPTGIEKNCKVARQSLTSDSHERSISSSDIFNGILFHDEFTFLAVNGASGNISICSKSKKVCCYLDYVKADATMANGDEEADLFAFGVFDGLHTSSFNFYFQICTLVRCADSHNRSSCGTATTKSNTAFKKIELHGTFETPYIYPQVNLHEPPSGFKLAEPHEWSYDGKTLLTNSEMQSPVLSAALLGRDYSRDKCLSSR